MEIKVAIFEDNKLVRDALEAILNGTAGYTCCGTFPDGSRWEEKIKRSTPDVILMDIEMPGMNGIEVTRQMQQQYPEIKIVIQTVFNDSEKIFQALCAGASGYILKNDPPNKYLEAVTEVYNGGASMNVSVAKKALAFFSATSFTSFPAGDEEHNLSQREKEILLLMAEGLSCKAIADKVFISYDTVRTHVKHIYKKLHVNSRNEAVIKAGQLKAFSKL
ncbi:MAG: response regulator transcription factor [Chitinophagaceae bacterium]|nr:response regulator transcription factor [Chitinophagaceae bacterium]